MDQTQNILEDSLDLKIGNSDKHIQVIRYRSYSILLNYIPNHNPSRY